MHANLSQMHQATVGKIGPRVALRYRRDGVCHDLSWDDYRLQADWAGRGLIQLGVAPHDTLAILSENRYEWLVADHAMLSAAVITVPLHAALATKQVEYQLDHSQARGIIVSGQRQADKVFEALDRLPCLNFIITFESIRVPTTLRVLTWEELKHLGRHSDKKVADELDHRQKLLTGNDLATIIYTSGTTGKPKGVMLSHGNLVSTTEATLRLSSSFDSHDIILSWLPYSHVYARLCDHFLTTMGGHTLCLAESIDTLIDDLALFQPTWMTAVPRFYEKVWSTVESLSADQRHSQLRRIFGPRIRQLSSGGAPLPRHVCDGFFETGIPLLEGYGMTESSSVISFNRIDRRRVGTVGPCLDNIDVRIAQDGEILTRGPHVMQGYWRDPEATSKTIIGGWLHTGDVGEMDDDGFLAITDRKKDLIITSSGKNIAPGELELLLASDPYIDQAVVYGDGRQFVSAIIVPDFDNLKSVVGQITVEFNTEGNLIRSPAIHTFYENRTELIMGSVSQPERVKKFLLLSRPFQFDADELTTTMKVRRGFVIKKYENELMALYDA